MTNIIGIAGAPAKLHPRVFYAAIAALAIALGVAMTSQPAHAQATFKLLYAFPGGTSGSQPFAPLLRGSAGAFYGTTGSGGAFNRGTIFKLAAGKETVLYSFTGAADGADPTAGLIQDAAGNLYGTTYSSSSTSTFGAVFKLDTSGTFTVLHSFTGSPDGHGPATGVIRDAAGNLFGTTYLGGTFDQGTVYKVDANANETVLYSFTGGTDGANPVGGLVEDAAGNLYGTTYNGGASNSNGTVFKLDLSGTLTVLHTFAGSPDCGNPFATMIRDKFGNLYGSTFYGGTIDNGCLFKVAPSGRETVLYSFNPVPDGGNPTGLVQDASGNLYGTTNVGGSGESGIVFKVDKTGKETILYTFTGASDGAAPYAGLIRDSAGHLYGTTASAGAFNLGTVFELTFP